MRLFYAALLLTVTACAALAQGGPEIVIPGRPGIPVIIDGVDASWGIVERDFGLDRPNQAAPVVIYRPYLIAIPFAVRGYYPADGRSPGYGRLEIVPPRNRALPRPAPRYFRDWTSESDPGPVTQYPNYPIPPVIVEPRIGRNNTPPPKSNRAGENRRSP
jgi:hypothetical protein